MTGPGLLLRQRGLQATQGPGSIAAQILGLRAAPYSSAGSSSTTPQDDAAATPSAASRPVAQPGNDSTAKSAAAASSAASTSAAPPQQRPDHAQLSRPGLAQLNARAAAAANPNASSAAGTATPGYPSTSAARPAAAPAAAPAPAGPATIPALQALSPQLGEPGNPIQVGSDAVGAVVLVCMHLARTRCEGVGFVSPVRGRGAKGMGMRVCCCLPTPGRWAPKAPAAKAAAAAAAATRLPQLQISTHPQPAFLTRLGAPLHSPHKAAHALAYAPSPTSLIPPLCFQPTAPQTRPRHAVRSMPPAVRRTEHRGAVVPRSSLAARLRSGPLRKRRPLRGHSGPQRAGKAGAGGGGREHGSRCAMHVFVVIRGSGPGLKYVGYAGQYAGYVG